MVVNRAYITSLKPVGFGYESLKFLMFLSDPCEVLAHDFQSFLELSQMGSIKVSSKLFKPSTKFKLST